MYLKAVVKRAIFSSLQSIGYLQTALKTSFCGSITAREQCRTEQLTAGGSAFLNLFSSLASWEVQNSRLGAQEAAGSGYESCRHAWETERETSQKDLLVWLAPDLELIITLKIFSRTLAPVFPADDLAKAMAIKSLKRQPNQFRYHFLPAVPVVRDHYRQAGGAAHEKRN